MHPLVASLEAVVGDIAEPADDHDQLRLELLDDLGERVAPFLAAVATVGVHDAQVLDLGRLADPAPDARRGLDVDTVRRTPQLGEPPTDRPRLRVTDHEHPGRQRRVDHRVGRGVRAEQGEGIERSLLGGHGVVVDEHCSGARFVGPREPGAEHGEECARHPERQALPHLPDADRVLDEVEQEQRGGECRGETDRQQQPTGDREALVVEEQEDRPVHDVQPVADAADEHERSPREESGDTGVRGGVPHHHAREQPVHHHPHGEQARGVQPDEIPHRHLHGEGGRRRAISGGGPHERGDPGHHTGTHPPHRERCAEHELRGSGLERVVGALVAGTGGPEAAEREAEGGEGEQDLVELRSQAVRAEQHVHQHREHHVDLFLDRQRPHVLERRRVGEQLAVGAPGEDQVPVLPIGERGEPGAKADAAVRRGSEPPHLGDDEERHERGGHQAAESPLVEALHVDRGVLAVLLHEQAGDQKAREGEEHRDGEDPAAELAAEEDRLVVVEEHEWDAEATDAVERRQVRQLAVGQVPPAVAGGGSGSDDRIGRNGGDARHAGRDATRHSLPLR